MTGDVPALEGDSGSGGLSSRVQAVFAIVGDRDDTVPIERSESVYRALRAVGADATFVPVPGADRRLALRDRSR